MTRLVVLGVLSLATGFAQGHTCRCLYGQPCWPSTKLFQDLARQLSQPLLRPTAPALPCYSDEPGGCTEVRTRNDNGTWRANHPGAMQNVNFETYISLNGTISACYLNTTLGVPCKQGAIPPVGVDARTPKDVQVAVKFAKEHNLRVAVKNTGHDYLGRSTAKDSFLIWLHNLKEIKVHEGFVLTGAPNTKRYEAITLGAGVQWIEAYTAAHKAGRTVVGGVSSGGSVGAAGGWVMGGGHSALSARYGLGVDNVLQFTVVTSNGAHVVANAYTNPRLFWALKGGGGGTFGIVTSVTYKTHPIEPISAVFLITSFSSRAIAEEVTTEYVRLHPKLADQGWGGYSGLFSGLLQFLYLAPNVTPEQTNQTFGPFFELVKERSNGTALTFSETYPSFFDWYTALVLNGPAQVGGRQEISSRLLDRTVAQNRPEEVAKTIVSLVEDRKTGAVTWNFVAGGAVSRVDPESTGLNPAWREALVELVVGESWDDGASFEEIQQARKKIVTATKKLDPLSVDSAAYLNEATLYEEDFKKSFFGKHYDRLKEIKNEVDPDGLFVVPVGVGSEDWDSDLNCRL